MPPKKRKQPQGADGEQPTPKKRGRAPKSDGASASKAKASTSSKATKTTKDTSKDSVLTVPAVTDELRESVIAKCNIPHVCGKLLLCGATCWDLTGRSKDSSLITDSCLYAPNRIDALADVRVRHAASGSVACHSVIVDENWKAYSLGRNDRGQCGVPSGPAVTVPTVIPMLSSFRVLQASCGRGHTLVLTDSGHVFSFGDNRNAQLGLGHQNVVTKPSQVIMPSSAPVVKVACGADFSAVVNSDSHLFTFGSPEYGQLGHNTDGKYFVSSNKLAFNCELRPRRVMVFIEKDPRDGTKSVDVEGIIDVACGSNHWLAIDAKKRVFTCGFGGYGRLGHSSANDEFVPRLLPHFGNRDNMLATSVYAGSSFSFVVTDFGQAYFWGQAKMAGEATMYPTPVSDLYGWKTRSIGCCNKSIVVAADESLISWGPSPTYGELGYGPGQKSSAKPKLVEPVSDIYIHSVSCGYGHTLLIARDETDADKAALGKLEEFVCPT